MPAQSFTVEFDDGHKVEVAPTSRDLLKLEKLNITPDECGVFEYAYQGAFVVLQRLHRLGKLDFTPPATVEALQDCADIEVNMDETDPEGKGSGQVPVTG